MYVKSMEESLTRATSILKFCPGLVGYIFPARGIPAGETLVFLTTRVKITNELGSIFI